MRVALTTSLVALAVLTAAAPQSTEKARGISIPITRRSALVNEGKTVNVEVLHSQVANTRTKILRGFENYERNTGVKHPSALNSVQKRATGSVPLTNYQNLLWYGSITVGSPPNTFTVDFDTGSSDLFLPGPNCGTSCDGHTVYVPSDSSTSTDLGTTYTLEYGDGSSVDVDGYIDYVSIAGLTVTNQTLGVATYYTPSLSISNFPPDGLLGLGFQQISATGQPTPFECLNSEGVVDQPVFGFSLTQSGGELFLGGTNPSLYTGDFTYTPVTQKGFWQVNMDNIQGNGQTIQSNIDCIIDTGSSHIIGNPSDVQNLVNILGGQAAPSSFGSGFYTFACDSFPSISLTFGGTSFPIPESTLNLGTLPSDSSKCVIGIIGQDTDSSFWIIGDVFLQGVYTAFDVSHNEVGFANLA